MNSAKARSSRRSNILDHVLPPLFEGFDFSKASRTSKRRCLRRETSSLFPRTTLSQTAPSAPTGYPQLIARLVVRSHPSTSCVQCICQFLLQGVIACGAKATSRSKTTNLHLTDSRTSKSLHQWLAKKPSTSERFRYTESASVQ